MNKLSEIILKAKAVFNETFGSLKASMKEGDEQDYLAAEEELTKLIEMTLRQIR